MLSSRRQNRDNRQKKQQKKEQKKEQKQKNKQTNQALNILFGFNNFNELKLNLMDQRQNKSIQQAQLNNSGKYFNFLKKLINYLSVNQFILIKDCDMYMFKQGIKPEWEDKQNLGGGCFKIKIQKSKSNKLWENAVFSIISPNNKLINTINGIRIKIKDKFDQVEIWLNNSANEKDKLDLVKMYLKENLQLTQERIFNFYPFTTK